MSVTCMERGFSNKCGITLSDTVEGKAIAEVIASKPGVTISHYPALIRIDGIGRLEFDMREIGDVLGRDFDPYQFQVELSTHYGRMVLLDDEVVVFADPEEAAQYLAEGTWLPSPA